MAYFNNTKNFLVALKGDPGESPTITAERVTGGVKLTITNPDGSGSIQTVYDGTGGGGSSHGDVDNIKYKRTSEDGLIDTYEIQFEDGTAYEFQFHNGGKSGGSNIILDTELKTAGKAADAKAVGDRFEEIDEVIVDMASGGTGYVRNVQTFDGETTMKFFVGTQEEYTALTAEQKDDLFAIITNDTTQEAIVKAVEDVGYILDGSKTVKRAQCDMHNNDIYETYVRKSSRIVHWWNNTSTGIPYGFDNKIYLSNLTGGRDINAIVGVGFTVELTMYDGDESKTVSYDFQWSKSRFVDISEGSDTTMEIHFESTANHSSSTIEMFDLSGAFYMPAYSDKLYFYITDGGYDWYRFTSDSGVITTSYNVRNAPNRFNLKSMCWWYA